MYHYMPTNSTMMKRSGLAILGAQQLGLILVIVIISAILAAFAGSHVDRLTGATVNNFLNSGTILQILTDTSFFAIMAVGATIVIISGGIDLSVGAAYALCGVTTALAFHGHPDMGYGMVALGFVLCCAVGIACGLANGIMITGLGVHPFIITLGTMMIFRGIAFVSTKAESILLPKAFTEVAKANLGLPGNLYPVPMLTMFCVAGLGWMFLSKMVAGRRVFAVGGNPVASRYAGVRIKRVLIGVYAFSGLTAAIAAFVGAGYYGSATSGDGTGYELFVIASAVVGGASLSGGKGSAISALLGALLIALLRQAVRTLHFDQNYEQIIIGCAIIIAVVLDRVSAALSAKRMTKMTS